MEGVRDDWLSAPKATCRGPHAGAVHDRHGGCLSALATGANSAFRFGAVISAVGIVLSVFAGKPLPTRRPGPRRPKHPWPKNDASIEIPNEAVTS